MAPEKQILEVRRHSLMTSIIIAISISIVGALYLAFAPFERYERVVAESVLGGWIDAWQVAHPVLSLIIVGVGMVYVSIKLSQLVSRFNLYGTTSHLTLELFPLLSIGVMVNEASLKVFVVVALVAYSLMRYVSSYRNANAVGVLLSGSLALGAVALLYPPAIVLWGVVPCLLVIFERTLREVIVAICSLAIVPFAYIYTRWFLGDDFCDVWREFVGRIVADSGYSLFESYSVGMLVFSGVLLFVSITAVFAVSLLENTVKARHRLRIVILYWVAVAVMFSLPSVDSTIFAISAIPLSILMPIAMLKFGRGVSFIIYILLFVLSAVVMLNLL